MSVWVLVALTSSVGALLLLGAIGWLIVRVTSELKASRDRLASIERELNDLVRGAVGMGHRIVALEKRLQAVSSNKDGEHSSVEEFAYSQAMQMFEQGADVATVASNCGFSSSEAQLMALVQKQLKSKRSTSPDFS